MNKEMRQDMYDKAVTVIVKDFTSRGRVIDDPTVVSISTFFDEFVADESKPFPPDPVQYIMDGAEKAKK